MRLFPTLIVFVFLNALVNAENDMARKKGGYGSHGLHGIIYKSGLMSVVTFLAIKAKMIIVVSIALTVFVLGAKVWATFKYGNLLFDKGCHGYTQYAHEPLSFAHAPVGWEHDFVSPPDTMSSGPGPGPGYSYETYPASKL